MGSATLISLFLREEKWSYWRRGGGSGQYPRRHTGEALGDHLVSEVNGAEPPFVSRLRLPIEFIYERKTKEIFIENFVIKNVS